MLVLPRVRRERTVEDITADRLSRFPVLDLARQNDAARQLEVGHQRGDLWFLVSARDETVDRPVARLRAGGQDILLSLRQTVERVPSLGVRDGLHVGQEED